MVVGKNHNNSMGVSYRKNPLYSFAEQFKDITSTILTESGGIDLYDDPRRVLNNRTTDQALKDFFIEESYDIENMTPEEIEEHCEDMEQQYLNDRSGLLESVSMAGMNPVMGMTFPMHKWILMNMVFDKGGIPKFVADSPTFTISQEVRYLIDPEGNEIDMFKEQNKMTKALDSTAPLQTFDMDLPMTEDTEIVHNKLGGLAGVDKLSVETLIKAVQLKDAYFEKGDILPNEEGYVEIGGKVKTTDAPETHDIWIVINSPFTPGFSGQMGQGFDRTATHRLNHSYKTGANGATTTVSDIIFGTIKKDRISVTSVEQKVAKVRIQSRLDTSNHRATTCQVTWKPENSYVEIPNAIPINTTISPEEVKDISLLYNVNQTTKIMHLMKTVLGNYKDDKIHEALDESFAKLINSGDKRSSNLTEYDWAPRFSYGQDHVNWRHATFLDHLDSHVTRLMQALNDPNMTVTVYGDPDLVRKVTPTSYSYQTPASIGAVELDFTKTVYTSDRRFYQFIGSDKLRGTTQFIIILCPNGTDQILYRIYDYQMYLGNEIRNADNPALTALTSFERWKFVEYRPVQGRIDILHPSGINPDNYDVVPFKQVP